MVRTSIVFGSLLFNLSYSFLRSMISWCDSNVLGGAVVDEEVYIGMQRERRLILFKKGVVNNEFKEVEYGISVDKECVGRVVEDSKYVMVIVFPEKSTHKLKETEKEERERVCLLDKEMNLVGLKEMEDSGSVEVFGID